MAKASQTKKTEAQLHSDQLSDNVQTKSKLEICKIEERNSNDVKLLSQLGNHVILGTKSNWSVHSMPLPPSNKTQNW